MANVTYLLGAGASFGARDDKKHHLGRFTHGLPIMNEIRGALNDLLRYTTSTNWQTDYSVNDINANTNPEILTVAAELSEDIKWLFTAAYENHDTIDAFARKLALQNENELLFKLKTVLSILFMFIQGNNKPDLRYDKLIGDILIGESLDVAYLDPTIKILSWNYDIQFEIALHQYFKNYSLPRLHSEIMQALPCCGSEVSDIAFDIKKFGFLKLNGTAGLFVNSHNSITPLGSFPLEKSIFHYIDLYRKITLNKKSIDVMFQYAWQNIPLRENIKKHMKQVAERTEILIMIGYSFFSTNRDIDDMFFKNLRNIRKIYVQDEKPDDIIFRLKNRYISLVQGSDNPFIPRYDTRSFLSPKDA